MITQKQITPNQNNSQKSKLADANALLFSAIDDLNSSEDVDISQIAGDIDTAIELAKQVSEFLKSRKEWMVS